MFMLHLQHIVRSFSVGENLKYILNAELLSFAFIDKINKFDVCSYYSMYMMCAVPVCNVFALHKLFGI